MGITRKIRKKFEGPNHPWQRARLEKEAILKENYGIRRKTEIWKMNTILKNFKKQAKKLIAMAGAQADIEKKQLVNRLNRLGLIEKDATMDNILGLTIENLMDRRLQSKVLAMGMARTPMQARQIIVHGHICANDNVVDSPSYFVLTGDKISYTKTSKFNNPSHPERNKELKAKKAVKKKSWKKQRRSGIRERSVKNKNEKTTN